MARTKARTPQKCPVKTSMPSTSMPTMSTIMWMQKMP